MGEKSKKFESESITFEIIWNDGYKTYGEYPSETFNKLKATYKRDFPNIKDINIIGSATKRANKNLNLKFFFLY